MRTPIRWVVMGLVWATPVWAEQSRTAEIEAAREKKALAPETVSKTENALLEIKDRKVLERLSEGYHGLSASFGAMATGSGFAFGPRYLRDTLAGGRINFDASAMISTRLWQRYQIGFTMPRIADGKVLFDLHATQRDYRSLEYFGQGPDSSRNGRTAYRLKDTSLDAAGAVEVIPHLRVGGTMGALWTRVGAGKRDDIASTDQVFRESTTPGLTQQSDFLRSGVFGQIDYRDDPLGPKSGGSYVAQYTWYDDRTRDAFTFRRFDIDAQQYIAFFNRTRRLALRARMTLTDTTAGQRVPFYLQPYVGGSDDLRGFRPYRFTDRNAVVYNAEYRWEIFSGLDGALFFDAGKVMPRRGAMSFSDLETSAGFGFRFNARNRTFLRLDTGFSHEGFALWVKFNDPFLPRLFGTGSGQPLY